jgi:hypothetical protein
VSLYEKAKERRTLKEQRMIGKFLVKFQDTFSKDENDLGKTNLYEHSIDTGDTRPIKQRPRRVPISLSEEERKAIEQMKERGVIRESTSPWSSPIVLVRGKMEKLGPA